LRITAEFVNSAASATDLPDDRVPEVALVGRSNVGKSSLINALTRQKLARTSASPGKTRLINVYRVARGARPAFYLVDLPGYGFARGSRARGDDAQARRGGFEELTGAFFATERQAEVAAVLLVDARHPGLANDREAWAWLRQTVADAAVVATKIDKLARGERIRAIGQLESVFEDSVLPVSAVTGEGLDELWKLIDRLANNSSRPARARGSSPGKGGGETGQPTARAPHPRRPHRRRSSG
jgi:GTP-binding protein